ncbi:MAG: hypothetical protein V7641_1518 [Blastocatellia bacterium]
MNDAAAKLQTFERAVMWRRRWLALQDRVALALLASGLIAAAFVVLSRLQIVRVHWSLEIVAVITVMSALAWHWHRRRATGKEAAFLIDRTFALEDRLTTAHQILARGGPQREVERALIDDAAARLADKKAASVAPYHLRAWHAVALVGIAAFAASVMIPTKQLPGGVAIVEAQADIQTAGEQLEQVGEAIAKLAPAESETAKLAKEQAELGRSFRMSPESRAEALKQLSALEERIRKRHTELVATRADEIVSVAEKRLRNAIEPARKEKGNQDEVSETAQAAEDTASRDESQSAKASADKKTPAGNRRQSKVKEPANQSSTVAQSGDANRNVKAEPRPPNANGGEPQATAANQPPPSAAKDARQPKASDRRRRQANANTNQVAANQAPKAESNQPDNQPSPSDNQQGQPQNQPQKPDSDQPPANAVANANRPNVNPQSGNPPSAPPSANDVPPKADGQQSTEPNAQGNPPDPETAKDAANPLANLAAEQAGKMLPQLSEQLLKKAAELRDGKLSPDDIKGLQQSAELMARDLSKIAQSKEMQQMAEQLAKQITPEQIEQFARALGNQEQLKREMQAAARLMMENQQAKSTVAGMAQNLAKWGEQFDRRDRNQTGNRQPESNPTDQRQANNRSGRGTPNPEDERAGREIARAAGGLTEKTDGPRGRTGQGRDARLSGNPQRGAGGEFLFLKSPAGKGASRAPYTSAYPQYRREAERSVERSQVPPRLRSVVKSYFDAINPDATKKQ